MLSISTKKRPAVIWVVSLSALIFGILTIKSGGLVLFTEGAFHQQQGHFVPFIVWFNFIAGFAYIIAAIGLFRMTSWSSYLSYMIATATISIFILFGMYVISGGLYEMKTVGVMTVRTSFWMIISFVAYFQIARGSRGSSMA